MFSFFKNKLEKRIIELEAKTESIEVNLNKTMLLLNNLISEINNQKETNKKLSLALKGNFELIRDVIDISRKH